jgi:hypothetical protein
MPGIPMNQNHASLHSVEGTPIAGANEIPGMATHLNQPSPHFGPDPITRVALNSDFAPSHPRSSVHPRITSQQQRPREHAKSERFDPRAVALDPYATITTIAGDNEMVGQGCLPITVPNA